MTQSDAPFIIPRGVFKYATETELPSETANAVNTNLCVSFLKRFLLQGTHGTYMYIYLYYNQRKRNITI